MCGICLCVCLCCVCQGSIYVFLVSISTCLRLHTHQPTPVDIHAAPVSRQTQALDVTKQPVSATTAWALKKSYLISPDMPVKASCPIPWNEVSHSGTTPLKCRWCGDDIIHRMSDFLDKVVQHPPKSQVCSLHRLTEAEGAATGTRMRKMSENETRRSR